MKKLSNENAYAILEAGETFQFAGYDWTVCEVDKEHHTAVIQSHGVTSGAWPGYVMQKLGGKSNAFYGSDIDGEDISAYNNKMKELYDAIKEVENTSATYGKGLYLISKEKTGFTKEWGAPGSGNYWKSLKAAAENTRSFGTASNGVWLNIVYSRSGAWFVSGDGFCSYSGQSSDFVVAPAFNLDLSKVKVVGDEIIIIGNDNNDQSKNPSNNGGNFMTNELAKNIITEYVFADYDISSIYKFLNTEASLDESEKQLYSEALLTSAMQKAVIALSKPV